MTLNEFITQFKSDIKNIESVYKGLVITELSLPNVNKNIQHAYYNSYYVDAINNNQYIKLLVPTYVYNKAIEDGHQINENVSVDITIESISVDSRSTILIKISKIIESGISEQELFIKNLIKYCNENKLFERIKKPLPSLIKKIALISTASTNTLDDILSKLNYTNETKPFKVNSTSEAVAEQINLCQNEDYDVILLYRGGHEDKSMNIYSDIPVLNAIHNSNIHIGVALGHEIDIPFVYRLADSTYSTPTNFAQVVNEYNSTKINSLSELKNNMVHHISKIKKTILTQLDNCRFDISPSINKLNSSIMFHMEKINYHTTKALYDNSNTLSDLQNSIKHNTNVLMHKKEIELENIESNVNTSISAITNQFEMNLLLSHKTINSSLINTISEYRQKYIKLFANANRNAALTLSNIERNAITLNSNNQFLSNKLIQKLDNDLLNTHSNIQMKLSALELRITEKKSKSTKRVLIITLIALVIVVLIAATLYVKQ